MEDARWKANRIVTMGTINIQMVAMDSSVFYFLLKYDQTEKAHRKVAGFEGILSKRNTVLKSYSKLLFWLGL